MPRHVKSAINYYKDPGDGSSHPDVTARKRSTFNQPSVDLETIIHDITGEEEKFTLDRNCFQLYLHKSKVDRFDDEELIKDVYYEEVRQILKKV